MSFFISLCVDIWVWLFSFSRKYSIHDCEFVGVSLQKPVSKIKKKPIIFPNLQYFLSIVITYILLIYKVIGELFIEIPLLSINTKYNSNWNSYQ